MLSLRVVTLLSLWFCLASLMPGKQYLIETDDEPVKRRPYDENKTFWPDSQNKAWGGPWPINKSKKLGNKSQKVNVNQRGGYGADQEVNVNQVQPKSYEPPPPPRSYAPPPPPKTYAPPPPPPPPPPPETYAPPPSYEPPPTYERPRQEAYINQVGGYGSSQEANVNQKGGYGVDQIANVNQVSNKSNKRSRRRRGFEGSGRGG